MSEENVALIRSMYDMLPAGDFAALAGDEEAMGEVMTALERIVNPEVEVSLFGPSYTQIRETRRVESDSPEIKNAGATIFGVRDGQVTTVDSFLDRDEALEPPDCRSSALDEKRL